MDEVLQLKEQLKEKERELALLKNKLAQLEKVKTNAILMNLVCYYPLMMIETACNVAGSCNNVANEYCVCGSVI